MKSLLVSILLLSAPTILAQTILENGDLITGSSRPKTEKGVKVKFESYKPKGNRFDISDVEAGLYQRLVVENLNATGMAVVEVVYEYRDRDTNLRSGNAVKVIVGPIAAGRIKRELPIPRSHKAPSIAVLKVTIDRGFAQE